MKIETPLALGLVVWNGEKYLAQLLDSILAQKYNEFVIYILDNQSTDNTIKILKNYLLNDSRLVIIEDSIQRGFVDAQTYIFNNYLSKHNYCSFLCDDDVYEDNYFFDLMKVLSENKDVALVYGSYKYVTEEGIIIDHKKKYEFKISNILLLKGLIFLINRNCLDLFFGVYNVNIMKNSFKYFKRIDQNGYNHENLFLFSLLINHKVMKFKDAIFYYRIKNRPLIYKERGYADSKYISVQFLKDIIHNFNFLKKSINSIMNRRNKKNYFEIIVSIPFLIASYSKYTIFLYLKRIIFKSL